MKKEAVINLKNLSDEARTILVEAIPYNTNSATDEKLVDLYLKFMKVTNYKYEGEKSFNRFQGAVLGMKRAKKTLTYKDDTVLDVFQKVAL